jgi:hypothetical protein
MTRGRTIENTPEQQTTHQRGAVRGSRLTVSALGARRQVFDRSQKVVVLTFGKHKYEDIRMVPIDYLKWISESFASGKVRDTVDKELARRSGVATNHHPSDQKPKATNAKRTVQESVNGSHYQWIDRNGAMHWIPRDVVMSEDQNELCPF